MESELACQQQTNEENSGGNSNNNNNNVPTKAVDEDVLQEIVNTTSDDLPQQETNDITSAETDLPPPQPVRKKPRQKRRIQHGGTKRESTPMRYLGDAPDEDVAPLHNNGVEDKHTSNGKEWSSSSTSEVFFSMF